MPSDRSVKDEDILAGFASLHGAMATGFDQIRSDLHSEIHGMHQHISDFRSDVARKLRDVRNDISRLEQRMLRRFDDVDERLDNHETP